jgi:hypothetical protein
MPGDPSECREHANNCLRMASEARTRHGKETFLKLADSWLRLAAELDAAKALIDTSSNGRTKPS